jgi:hypothetical protein
MITEVPENIAASTFRIQVVQYPWKLPSSSVPLYEPQHRSYYQLIRTGKHVPVRSLFVLVVSQTNGIYIKKGPIDY